MLRDVPERAAMLRFVGQRWGLGSDTTGHWPPSTFPALCTIVPFQPFLPSTDLLSSLFCYWNNGFTNICWPGLRSQTVFTSPFLPVRTPDWHLIRTQAWTIDLWNCACITPSSQNHPSLNSWGSRHQHPRFKLIPSHLICCWSLLICLLTSKVSPVSSPKCGSLNTSHKAEPCGCHVPAQESSMAPSDMRGNVKALTSSWGVWPLWRILSHYRDLIRWFIWSKLYFENTLPVQIESRLKVKRRSRWGLSLETWESQMEGESSQTRGISGGGDKWREESYVTGGTDCSQWQIGCEGKELGSQDAARVSEEMAGCLPRQRQEKETFDLEVGVGGDEEVCWGPFGTHCVYGIKVECLMDPWTHETGSSKNMFEPVQISICWVTNHPKPSGLAQPSMIAHNFKATGWSGRSGLNSFIHLPVRSWVSGALAAFRGPHSHAWLLPWGQQVCWGCLLSAG